MWSLARRSWSGRRPIPFERVGRRAREGGSRRPRCTARGRRTGLGLLVRGAEQREVVQVERAEVELDQRACRSHPTRRTGRRAAARRAGAGHRGPPTTSTTTSISPPPPDVTRSLVAPHHLAAHPGRGAATALALRCDCHDRCAPVPPCELDRRRADAAGGTGDPGRPPPARHAGACRSTFSAVDVAHGIEASSTSVQSHRTAMGLARSGREVLGDAPSISEPSVTVVNGSPVGDCCIVATIHPLADPVVGATPGADRDDVAASSRLPGCVGSPSAPDQPPSSSAPFVYQPIRVLMSVSFTPAAATGTNTSPGPGCGTATSSRSCSTSGPPCCVSSTARIVVGMSGPVTRPFHHAVSAHPR